MRMSTLRVLVLGDHKVGKSAVTVRFLTKRFIGEYCSDTDHVYRHVIQQEDSCTDVEVCDTCSRQCPSNVEDNKILQADAFVIIYSVCNRRSFITAKNILHSISKLRPPTTVSSSSSSSSPSSSQFHTPTLLLGNMTDLEHLREVGVDEGHELSMAHGCQHYEVSAADSALSVDVAFSAFLREARSVVQHRAVLKRRRSSLGRRIGGLFSKAALGSSGSSNSKGSNGSGSSSSSSSSNKTVMLTRSSSVGDSTKSVSSSSNNGKAPLRRCSSSSDATRPVTVISSNNVSKDKERDTNGDFVDKKLVSALSVTKDNNPSSSTSSTGSDVYISDALRRRASLVNNNNNNHIHINGSDNERRKMSLPTVPEVCAGLEKKKLQNLLNGNKSSACVDSEKARERPLSGEADRR